MHAVYIIYSEASDIYYKGYTTQIQIRLQQHNSNDSRYTAGKGPWKLVYSRTFETKTEALIEEKRLKRLNRTAIEKLIAG